MSTIEELKAENEALRAQVRELLQRLDMVQSQGASFTDTTSVVRLLDAATPEDFAKSPDNHKALSIIVLGASGDLAKKKTFPALFHLYRAGLIPHKVVILGYARSAMTRKQFISHISQYLPKDMETEKSAFLERCEYFSGNYDDAKAMRCAAEKLAQLEKEAKPGAHGANRIFYLAVPPSIFAKTAPVIKMEAFSSTGWNRVIVEKPFGKDEKSSAKLNEALAICFSEPQIYRIDHYLGKGMVQNLMVLRFANIAYEPLWNKHYIANVRITFKENFGTEGRAGYFDEYGIIRDVMQNHLIQMLTLVAMEPPVSLCAEDVRDEKVKVLRSIPPVDINDVVIGQYTRNPDGTGEDYHDDKGVPSDSLTPTFACAVLHINNTRWHGVPFILTCGKGLNERKAEIRIQFKRGTEHLFPDCVPNELVLRVQPNEAIYLKFTTKVPGLSSKLVQSELDLTYKSRFDVNHAPDAYERLILDVVRGDRNLFVRVDELQAAWRIFTPLLHKLEKEKIKPIPYPFGSRGPKEAYELAERYGWRHYEGYEWRDHK